MGKSDEQTADASTSLRSMFSGRRGALLLALLFTEFGGAVQSIAYSSVLPIAAEDLHGAGLYGATLAAGSFTQILVLAIGSAPFARLRPITLLGTATVLFVVGSVVAVAAVSMSMILIGTVVRGIAGGMLAGFGLSILGGLFGDKERTRVYGLFAMMWLLPSMVGPAINAVVTLAWGWRAALAWPALLVIAGRMLIGKNIDLVPWKNSTAARPSLTWVAVLLGGLVLATVATLPKGATGIALLVVGCVLATVASVRILQIQVGSERARLGKVVLLFLLCLCYFGGAGIVSLAAITGLGYGIVAGTVVVGAGLLTWSLTGFKPELADRWIPKPQVTGLVLVTVALIAAVATQTFLTGTTALVVLIGSWFLAGAGMGISYPRFSASAMDELPPERVLPVATAVAFSETAGTAIAGFVGGGTYSVLRSLGYAATTALSWGFLLLAAFGAGSVVLYRWLWTGQPVAGEPVDTSGVHRRAADDD